MSLTRNDQWSQKESNSAKIGSALSSEVRIRILKILIENPGINATELSKLMKRHRSTIDDHLYFLKRANLIYDSYTFHQIQLFVDSQKEELLTFFV